MENLLSPETLRAVVRDYEGDDSELNDFVYDDSADKYLGTFIEEELLKAASRRPVRTGRPYAKESGTIKDKDAFCRKALLQMTELADCSESARELARRVYGFINEHNR